MGWQPYYVEEKFKCLLFIYLFIYLGQECISNYLHLLILEERNRLHAGNNKSGTLNI